MLEVFISDILREELSILELYKYKCSKIEYNYYVCIHTIYVYIQQVMECGMRMRHQHEGVRNGNVNSEHIENSSMVKRDTKGKTRYDKNEDVSDRMRDTWQSDEPLPCNPCSACALCHASLGLHRSGQLNTSTAQNCHIH